jgi:hypothetical protein
MKRFKTKEEFEKEYGEEWMSRVPGGWNEQMNGALGQPYSDGIGGGKKLPNCLYSYMVREEMLTDKPLPVTEFKKGDIVRCKPGYTTGDTEGDDIQAGGGYVSGKEYTVNYTSEVKKGTIVWPVGGNGIYSHALELVSRADQPIEVKRGKWYYINGPYKGVALVKSVEGIKTRTYCCAFTNGDVHENGWDETSRFTRLATAEEIKQGLIAITYKKGFKTGLEFEGLRDVDAKEKVTPDEICGTNYSKHKAMFSNNFYYNINTDTFYTYGYGVYVVYSQNNWASTTRKPIEDRILEPAFPKSAMLRELEEEAQAIRSGKPMPKITSLKEAESSEFNKCQTINTNKQNGEKISTVRGEVIKASCSSATIRESERREGQVISSRKRRAKIILGHSFN